MGQDAARRVGVVIITRDRCESLLQTLAHLHKLPGSPPIAVVDNGSSDGTVEAVEQAYPDVRVIPLQQNLGAAGRNAGVQAIGTPYVAFSDDDSWWAPEAFERATALFDAHPRLAVIAGRVLVGETQRTDPVCDLMSNSPVLSPRPLPGPAVLGFIACGAIVRSDAFLAAGGFHQAFGVGGEEELLAIDLAAAGRDIAYVDDIVAYHHPSPSRNPARREAVQLRNDLWVTWLRRPIRVAAGRTVGVARRIPRDPAARSALREALAGLPWVLRSRRRVPRRVEREIQRLAQAAASGR